MQNAKHYIFIIIASLLIGAVTTYSWNNQTLSEMVEEHNQQILSDCLTKARIQKTAKEILEYASNCNQDILTNISTPRSVETITWTHSTGNTVQSLWFQLIPQASAKQLSTTFVEKTTNQEKELNEKDSSNVTAKIRTPFQIYELVKHLWYREAPTISLISTCKASSWDPRHCILVWLVLMYNEAGNKQNSKACIDRNNCFGIKSWKAVYSSLDEGMENFVQKYNKWWINVKSAEDFYPDLWKLSKTRYCYSETQHHPNIGCPDGQKIAQSKWKQLTPIIYE